VRPVVEIDVEHEVVEGCLGWAEIGAGRQHRDALGSAVEYAPGGCISQPDGEVQALARAQTERRTEPGPGRRRPFGLDEPRPLDGHARGVEPHVAGDGAKTLRRLGPEIEPDVRVDEGGSRQAALQVEERGRVGKAEERAAKANADPTVAYRRDA